MPSATLREMLEAGVHFGHQTRYWNPSMKPYIFGERNKIHIIDLEITQQLLDAAAAQARQLAADGKTILLVGTKRAAQDLVRAKAQECGMPYVAQRWLGGTLTNFHTVRNSLKRLQDLKRMEEENLLARISKKEALRMTREKLKLERSLGGIEAMERLPDALFVIDVRHEGIAVREARRLGIPVIAVVDSNSSIEGIDCIIPGNDDAIRSIRLYLDIIGAAIMEGRKQAKETAKEAAGQAPARGAAVKRKGRRPTLRTAAKGEAKAEVKEGGKGEAEAEVKEDAKAEVKEDAKAAPQAAADAAVEEGVGDAAETDAAADEPVAEAVPADAEPEPAAKPGDAA